MESYSCSDQVTLDTPTTSQSHVDRLSDVPTLPLPLVKSQLTRVTFATKATPPAMGKSLLPAVNITSFSKPRASSFNVSTDHDFDKSKRLSSQSSEDLNFNLSRAKVTDIGAHLRTIASQSQTSSVNLIVGAQDYDPSRGGASTAEWEELEKKAASGCQGVSRENFAPSTLVMDSTTDNSKMPHCVVNGKEERGRC